VKNYPQSVTAKSLGKNVLSQNVRKNIQAYSSDCWPFWLFSNWFN